MGTKREPEEVWKKAVQEAAEDEREFQRAASASVEDAERDLADMGFDVEAEREQALEWRREIEQRRAARKAKAQASPTPIRRPQRTSPQSIVWLLASSLGALVGGGTVYLTSHPTLVPGAGTVTPPTSVTAPPGPPPADLAVAADLRRDAIAECAAKEWERCLADLDRARALDLEGDMTHEMADLRQRAIDGIYEVHPTDPNKLLKPPAP